MISNFSSSVRKPTEELFLLNSFAKNYPDSTTSKLNNILKNKGLSSNEFGKFSQNAIFKNTTFELG